MFTIVDYYGQKVKQNASVVSTEVVTQSAYCESNLPSFVNSTGSLPVDSGVANFSSVLARCTPGGSMVVQYSTATQVFTDLSTQVSYAFENCEAGDTYVQDTAGQSTCAPCPEGEFSLSYTGPKSAKCLPCNVITGVASCSGKDLVLEPGYWRQSATTSSVVQCQQQGEQCVGGASIGDASCKRGSEGPLCGVCSEGYFAGEDGTCLECDSAGAGVTGGVIVIILLCGLFVLLYVAKRFYSSQGIKSKSADGQKDGEIRFRSPTLQWIWERKREVTTKIKIVVVTTQVVSAIPTAVGVTPPPSLYNFFGLFHFLSFNYATIIPFGCSISYDYVDVLSATTIGPIVIALMIWIASAVESYWYVSGRDTKEGRGEETQTRYYQYFLYLTYLVLPSVTVVIFGMFPCQNVDEQEEDQYYLRNDLSISCSSERYTTGVTIAAIMIVVYPFGIPLMYWWQLFRYRGIIQNRSTDNTQQIADIASKYGFLYESYEPRFWYWESVEAIRRIVLTGVVSVLSPSSSTQSVAGMILALIYIGLYGQLKPYENGKDDTLAFVGQYQIFWTFFGTLVIGNGLLGSKQDKTVAVFIIIGNLLVFFLGSFYEISDYRHELGLRSFEDLLGPYLKYIPFSSELRKRNAMKNNAQKGAEEEVERLSKVLSRLREEGLDERTVSHVRFLVYLKYASLRKEALKRECDDMCNNLNRSLSRVKRRIINVIEAEEAHNESPQVEMIESPLQRPTGRDQA